MMSPANLRRCRRCDGAGRVVDEHDGRRYPCGAAECPACEADGCQLCDGTGAVDEVVAVAYLRVQAEAANESSDYGVALRMGA